MLDIVSLKCIVVMVMRKVTANEEDCKVMPNCSMQIEKQYKMEN